MKKRRHRAKSDILIDLTSLLDVIFIVLLVVIIRQHNLTEIQKEQIEASTTAEEERKAAEEARAKYELYMDQLDTEEQLQKLSGSVSIYCYFNSENERERHVEILQKGSEQEVVSVELWGDNVEDQFEKVRAVLEEYVSANTDIPVYLSLSTKEEKILYRDERDILQIFLDLKETYSNIFLK